MSPTEADHEQRSPNGILVVDDEPIICKLLEHVFRQAGLTVWTTASGPAAVELCNRLGAAVRLVLLDVQMPRWDGPQTWAALKQLAPHLRCAFMSAEPTPYTVEQLLAFGAECYLTKPLQFDRLLRLARSVLGEESQ